MCAARVQHTCVTCAGVHVCSMFAVYMPNMCSKVADIYAVCICMLYCACMYSAYLMCLYVACFIFCVCSTHENFVLIPEINLLALAFIYHQYSNKGTLGLLINDYHYM